MLKSTHSQILIKPYSQIKDLKLHCSGELEIIKTQHQSAWQVFKAFNLKVWQNLPSHFAKPHIQNWCNGWEIRRHFFAYYKYESYLGNAPIIVVILNKERLIVALTWHSYKANSSKTNLDKFNGWIDEIDFEEFGDFYVWHSNVSEYGSFTKVSAFDYNQVQLKQGEFYRLGRFIDKKDLDNYSDDELMAWVLDTIKRLGKVYEWCH